MKIHKISFLTLILTAVLISGCASTTAERRLDQKVAEEPTITKQKEISAEADQITQTTPGLSADQKTKLATMRADLRAKIGQINKTSLELRSVLIKNVISTNYDAKEVTAVENRLRDLSKQRLDAIFGAVRSTNRIVGRSDLVQEAVDQQLLEDDVFFNE